MNKIPAFDSYPCNVDQLPTGEGGGYVLTFPDLPGCISDGAIVEQAISQGREAFQAWMESVIEDGKPIPTPNGLAEPAKLVL